MTAHRALLRRDGSLVDIAAVEAHPADALAALEEASVFQGACIPAEPVAVGLFDGGDHPESVRNLVKAFLFRHVGKVLVIVLKLLVLVVRCV